MKKFLILGLIVIVAVIAWVSLSGDKAAAPTTDTMTTEQAPATAATVESDLQGLGDEDLDAEMMAIDADIKTL